MKRKLFFAGIIWLLAGWSCRNGSDSKTETDKKDSPAAVQTTEELACDRLYKLARTTATGDNVDEKIQSAMIHWIDSLAGILPAAVLNFGGADIQAPNSITIGTLLADIRKIISAVKIGSGDYRLLKGRSLSFIPDIHASLQGQTEESSQTQAKIRQLVRDNDFQILFVEGMSYGPITRESWIKELLLSGQLFGIETTRDKAEEMIGKYRDMFWWPDFMGSKKIYGLDDLKLNFDINFLAVAHDQLEHQKETAELDGLRNFLDALNFCWRERQLLRNINSVIAAAGNGSQVIVLGMNHEKTFPKLAGQYGLDVNCLAIN